jgi:hypothetical protein
MKHMKLPLLALLAALAAGPLAAQNPQAVVTTVGKTFESHGGAKRHNYLLWQPGDLISTYDKRFAVHVKEGGIDSPQPFRLLGIQTVQTSPSAVQALLNLGARFDADAAWVAPRIVTIYHDSKSNLGAIPNPLPTAIDATIAGQLAELLAAAKGDPKLLERLMLLGRAHPGILMAMGHGFAIEVPPSSLHTYEVREVDANDSDLRVIGRVELDAANPQDLAAPGRPHQVFHAVDPELQWTASNKDHLNARLRWAMPDSLRELLPHSSGFNVYRVSEVVAQLKGWDSSPPDRADLLQELAAQANLPDPPVRRVNILPINGVIPLSEPEAADSGDHETVFFSDTKNPPELPFVDGEAVYYFVAARDIAGHIGPVSPGTRVVMCHRVPPDTPEIIEVVNTFRAPAAAATLAQDRALQHLTVRFHQLPDGQAGRYQIYRWDAATQWLSEGGNPSHRLVGTLDHLPGQELIEFHDAAPGHETLNLDSTDPATLDPDIPMALDSTHPLMGKTIWYTVRAEDLTACTPKNLSGHSNPEFGVLRDRAAPDAPSGAVTRCLNTPNTSHVNNQTEAKAAFGLDEDFTGLWFRFDRQHKLIKSVEAELVLPDPNGDIVLFSGIRLFKGSAPSLEFPIPARPGASLLLRARCFSHAGVASNWATTDVIVLPGAEQAVVRALFAGELTCSPELIPPGAPAPTHDVVGPDGATVPLPGVLVLNPGDRQWRVYRRVGPSGELELLASGQGGGGQATWTDSAPPTVSGTVVCYYGQVLDEHGNASPLARLQCVTIRSAALPVPLLADAEPLDPSPYDEPQARLRWFCDPVGVERFEIWMSFEGGEPEFEPHGNALSPRLSVLSAVQLETPEGLRSFIPFQTPGMDTDFGATKPDFSVEFALPADKRVFFAVRAVSPGAVADPVESRRAAGDFSNVVALSWAPPPTEPSQEVIPWPERKLAGIQGLAREVSAFQPGEGPLFASPAPASLKASAVILLGAYPSPDQTADIHEGIFPAGAEPMDFLFQVRPGGPAAVGTPAESLFPFAVYRFQIGGEEGAKPNLTQITPLIDRISRHTPAPNQPVTARDPFFVFLPHASSPMPVPVQGGFNLYYSQWEAEPIPSDPTLRPRYLLGTDASIWLRDPLPASAGCRYQYLIVRFTARGEIDRVIPTNIVQHQP